MHDYTTAHDDQSEFGEWYPPTETYRDGYGSGPWTEGADGVDTVDGRPATRLTHLVLVDGRLVDMWNDSVAGTRWERHAKRFDRELHRPQPEPPKPAYERALVWLEDLCGGRAAVELLDTAPLTDDGLDVPEVPEPQWRARLESTAELLDALAERWFDAETSYAFRRALLHVWADEPEVVLEAATAAHVAGGVAWVVGKANGLLRPQGDMRIGQVKDALALSASPSTYGKVVQGGLRGFRERSSAGWWRPDGLPDLLATGHSDVLLSSVRRRLVRVRERALEAQAEALAR